MEGGCDLFLIETMADLQEAKAAVIGAKKGIRLAGDLHHDF